MLAFPLMIVLIIPSADISASIRDEARFYIHKGRYDAEVVRAKAEGRHFAVIDDWSLFVTANAFVVWDEFDKPEEVISGFKPYQSFGHHFYLVGN